MSKDQIEQEIDQLVLILRRGLRDGGERNLQHTLNGVALGVFLAMREMDRLSVRVTQLLHALMKRSAVIKHRRERTKQPHLVKKTPKG